MVENVTPDVPQPCSWFREDTMPHKIRPVIELVGNILDLNAMAFINFCSCVHRSAWTPALQLCRKDMSRPLYRGTSTFLHSRLVVNANWSQLIHLSSNMPSRCVLLLEDIDVSGIDLSIVALLDNSHRRDLPSSISISFRTVKNKICSSSSPENDS